MKIIDFSILFFIYNSLFYFSIGFIMKAVRHFSLRQSSFSEFSPLAVSNLAIQQGLRPEGSEGQYIQSIRGGSFVKIFAHAHLCVS